MWGMSVYVGRAAGNTSHGGAGRGCQDPGLAKLNYSVLVARGQAISSLMCEVKIVQVYRYSVRILVRFQFVVSSSGGDASE